jgi:bleomycin hydrolase
VAGNIWGGRPVLYVNTTTDDLKDAVVKMIKAGLPVFFGSDVGQSSDRVSGSSLACLCIRLGTADTCAGVMDAELMDYETAFNIKLGLTKAQRLQSGESLMTHAMVITAVHLDDAGKPVRFKVENSWGTEPGEKGWFMCTASWFDECVIGCAFAPVGG